MTKASRRLKSAWICSVAAFAVITCTLTAWAGTLDPSRWGAWAEMCVLAFPAAWMLALLVCICFAATCRWAACAAVALALAVAWPMAKVTFALEHISRQQQSDSSFTVKVMSYNVHGFNAEDHRVKNRPNITMEAVVQSGADIVALQEAVYYGWNYADIPSMAPLLDTIRATYPYRTEDHSAKVTLLSRYPFTATKLGNRPARNQYGKMIIRNDATAYRIELPDGKQLTLINAYMASYELSPAERKLSGLGHRPDATDSTTLLQKFNMALNVRVSQARVIGDFIKKKTRHIIMCCDMNDVPGSFCYRMLTGSGLRDAYQQSGIGYLYTYNVGPFYFHLDHMLHSSDIAVTHFERPKAGISDHYPIVATFTVQ